MVTATTEKVAANKPPPYHGGGKAGRKSPSKLLRDLRHVYEQPEEKDTTPGQKMLRQLLKNNPKEFLTKLSQEERSLMTGRNQAQAAVKEAPQPSGVPGGTPAYDDGSVKVEELIERLLKEAAKP